MDWTKGLEDKGTKGQRNKGKKEQGKKGENGPKKNLNSYILNVKGF